MVRLVAQRHMQCWYRMYRGVKAVLDETGMHELPGEDVVLPGSRDENNRQLKEDENSRDNSWLVG